jgi:DNA recombination protein RmuC
MTTDSVLLATLAAGFVLAGAVLLAVLRGRREAAAQVALIAQSAERLAAAQDELKGRVATLAESQAAQQQAIARTLEERLESLSKRLGDGLNDHAEKTGQTMKALHERLAVIDAAQKNLTDLSAQVIGLQDILSNKQARGVFGEVQLNDLVGGILPPSAYGLQVTLGNGSRVDCLINLPNPPGPIAIDAKFPLESYRALATAKEDAPRVQAARAFGADIRRHVADIRAKYIIPGETAESALMFLPSEAIYAELHANFANVVEESYRARVWIVSPTTLMALLNTVRAVLKDYRMREQADLIQAEVHRMLEDVGRLDERVGKLQRHFDQATEDIRNIRTSTDRIAKRGERIEEMQIEGEPPDTLPPPDTPP